MAQKESMIRAVNKFNREKTKSVQVRLNLNTDADILAKLDAVDSKMGYIKRLIREDLKKNGY
jgi:hypothetical protein